MDDHPSRSITRRAFLAGTVAAALAACSDGGESGSSSSATGAPTSTSPSGTSPPTTAASTTVATTTVPATTAPETTEATTTTVAAIESDPFTLGVASGDPLHDSVILWTRLAPETPIAAERVDVEWEVATDVEMTEVVASGAAPALAALAHSVHVDVRGLEPDTEYHYRFRLGDFETSPARTRTFAAPGTMPERFRFAFSSCQNWEQGEYAAYRDLAEQGDLDAFVFLGDYIYEYAAGGYSDPRSRQLGQDFECETLDQYRDRYALYKSDPLLRQAHELAPWIITWDDHEVDNDYAGASSEQDEPRGPFLDRRAAAYQAWYEHMPVRLDPPEGADYDIYRAFSHGELIRFHVLDTRQYRSDQQRGVAPVESLVGTALQIRDDPVVMSPDQTMLGSDQFDWLVAGVSSSPATWDAITQQVFMFGANAMAGTDPPWVLVDTWDGYAGERERLLAAIGESADNLVVLTGDFHSAAVADLRVDPFDTSQPVIGTELMASAISSAFFDDTAAVTDLVAAAIETNPHIQWFDRRRGYTVCEVTPERWRATFRAVADPFDAASAVETISEWEIAAGVPGALATA